MKTFIVTIACTNPPANFVVTESTIIVEAASEAEACSKVNGTKVEQIGWRQAVHARILGDPEPEIPVSQSEIDRITDASAIREKQRVSCRAANAARRARRARRATEGVE